MKTIWLAAILVLAGCGGSGPAPGPFDGRWIGVQSGSERPFVQWSVVRGRIEGGHISQEDRFLDRCEGEVKPDGTFSVVFPQESVAGVLVIEKGRLTGGPFVLLRSPK